ncbi:MAG: DUF6511 domain-containing protein, partial [Wenzhouxiangella sp.]
IDRAGDHQCVVCSRAAGSYAYWPRGEIPGFACSLECAYLAQWVREMTTTELDELELGALDRASDEAGAYLESVGKTDLGELTPGEWKEFLARVALGFSKGLKKAVEGRARVAPPY